MLVFAAPLPGTPAHALTGLGATIVGRRPDEARAPGTVCWVGDLPGHARAGDHVLLPLGSPTTATAKARGVRVWWRCRHPREVRAAQSAGIAVWAEGAEAGGVTGRNTALVLIRALFEEGPPAQPWVIAGLTPGARAASLAVGAAGIVLDTELWGIPQSPLHPQRRLGLSRAGPRDTHLVGDIDGLGVRLWTSREELPALAKDVHQHGLDALIATLEDWWTRPSGPAPAPVSLACAAGDGDAASRVDTATRVVRSHLRQIADHHPLRAGCDPLGTGVPIVQGPMANVAEGRGLAAAVSASGALPFVALGALRLDDAERVLDDVADVPRCGAGLIAFDIAPHRDAHIQALAARGPRPVILAGGTPTLAASLAALGLEPWLHTPSPRLAGFAVGSGVPAVVLEGHEAGGHVGPVPSSALWDLALAEVVTRQAADAPPLVVLAGGIGDAVSAAFAAALAAPACAQGVRVALQVGTAFFFTHEIVQAGQITALCQETAVQTQDTVLVGESVNLPLRCAPNAFTTEARANEAAWIAQDLDLRGRRQRMERLNLGRTRMAARSIERDPDWDGQDPAHRHRAVAPERARREGAFTLGQGAVTTERVRTVAELVHCLTVGARAVLHRSSRWGAAQSVPGSPSEASRGPEIAVPLGALRGGLPPAATGDPAGPIAIVGLGCVLPGGPDLLGWWSSQMRGVDAIQSIPTERWNTSRYADPRAGATGPGRSASIAAGVAADVPFDPLRYRIPPRVLPTVDRAQRLALLASDEALTDAGLLGADTARSAVMLGNAMGGEWRSKMALRVRFREVIDRLGIEPEALEALEHAVEARLDAEIVPLQGESMVGLLGNVAAGRVAAWLDWRGGSHTVDGACAASLLAVVHAVEALRSGRVDLVVSGGVDTDLAIDTYVGFTRTRALSSAGSRPFSRDADGFVMGEGAACFAMVRLEDAVRRGLPVWAVIRGIGTSSDGRARGLTAPDPEGQRLAVERAWHDAGRSTGDAVYIEAHGTGTELGDRTEAQVLSELFEGAWVGTAKGAVGHLKSAAGAAGLLRGALAAATGILPPTHHVGPPIPEAQGLKVVRRPTRLPEGVPLTGISAFGFGGTNAHLVLSAPPAGVPRPAALAALEDLAEPFLSPPKSARWTATSEPSPARLTPSPRLHLFVADSRSALAEAVRTRRLSSLTATGSMRLAVLVDPHSHPDTNALMSTVAAALDAQTPLPQPGRVTWLESTRRPVVIVAPGQGAQRAGAWASVCRFPAAAALLPPLEQALGGSIELPGTPDTRDLHRHLFAIGAAWARVLRACGVPIAGAIGHSLGELAALVAAGCADPIALASAVRTRGEVLHGGPSGAMLAVIGSAEHAAQLARSAGLHVAARNSDRATVLAGPADAVRAAAERASDLGLRCRQVDVAHPFHTPAMASATPVFEAAIRAVPLRAGPWSSALARPPDDPSEALVAAISATVDFGARLVELAPADALVVELGPGRTLAGHARALGLDAVALDPDPGSDPHGPVRAAAALWAAGHPQLLRACPGVDLRVASTRRHVGAAAFVAAPVQAAADPIQANTTRPPTPAAPPAAVTEHAAAPTRERVLAALNEITGYTHDTLAAAADLQADLGIDSIQRLEVVGLLQQSMSLRLAPEDERALEGADVDGIVEIIDRSLARGAPPTPSRSARTWVLAPEWVPTCVTADTEVPTGSSRRGDRPVFRPSLSGDLPADILAGVRQAPRSAQSCIIVVPDTPEGHAVAAAVRCAIGESGGSIVEVRVSAGQVPRLPSVLPPGDLFRLGPSGLQARVWRPLPASTRRPVERLLATGGVRGILPSLIAEIAPKAAVIVGRTPAKELVRELTELARVQPQLRYLQADATSDADLQQAIEALGGPPDHVLHGAAVLRDGRAEALVPEDIRAVFAPKVEGLRALRRVAPEAVISVISSIAAHAASPGQSAYAAANSMAEALADRAIALTAIADRGLAASAHVRAALETRGVRPLPLQRAAEIVADAVTGANTLILASTSPPPGAAWSVQSQEAADDGAVLHLGLDPDQPALDDHRVGGRPVVPAATWVHLALCRSSRIEDFHVDAALFVDDAREDVQVAFKDDAMVVSAGLRTLATGRLSELFQRPDADAPADTATADASALYREDLLFHGPRWKVLDRVGGDGNGTMWGVLRPDSGLEGAIDAAHQLLACWSASSLGWTGLPVAATAWTRFAGGPPVRLRIHPTGTGQELSGEVLGFDAENTIVLHGEGVRLRRATSVSPATQRALTDAGLGTGGRDA